MFRSLKIGTKITLLVLLIVLISVLSISYIAYRQSRISIEEKALESMTVLTNLKVQKIESYIERVNSNLRFGSELESLQEKLAEANNISTETEEPIDFVADSIINKQDSLNQEKIQADSLEVEKITKIQEKIQSKSASIETEKLSKVLSAIRETYGINHIFLLNEKGSVVLELGDPSPIKAKKGRKFTDPEGKALIMSKDTSIAYSSVYYNSKDQSLRASETDFFLMIYVTIFDENEDPKGILVYELKMDYIYNLVNDTTGLNNTGEIILVDGKTPTEISYLNEIRSKSVSTLQKHEIVKGEENKDFYVKAIKDAEGYSLNELDHLGKPVLAVWKKLKYLGWGVIVKQDIKEVYEPTQKLANFFLLAGMVVFLIALVIGLLFSRVLINPILYLKDNINLLAKGALPQKAEQNSGDEIGEMTNQLNQLVENLRRTANFAERIGEGDLEANFRPISEQDTLGVSLLTMRDSIQQSASRDEERNWIVTGLAEIGDILRSTSDIKVLGEMVVEYVTKRIKAVQGAFYSISSIDDEENAYLEMNASYAYNKKKYLHGRFKIGEGLIGQAAIEQDTIVRTEIPNEYVTITSGLLGDQKPKAIIITPLITEDQQKRKVYGALEFASFKPFGSREIKFVEEISEIIARTVFNIKVNENTKKLLSASEVMRNDLEMQQRVLTQNAEVMENTQEELREKNQELEKSINEVKKANDKTRLLLENASEVITIYKEDKTISYISPSVGKILGYSQEEMIGVSDIIYIEEGKDAFRDMFQSLILKPDKKRTIQFSYKRKNGEKIWLEATGNNLIEDPAIQGIVVNTRDITERRRAEEEERKRGAMQALSENSPDLITRISKEGTVFYINPIIENYTGHDKAEYLQKPLADIDISPKIIDTWGNILGEVLDKSDKVSKEVDFPSDMGERIMQVNAIPEYNDHQVLDSVLIVSHDITERKTIELEVQYKNKKITESINYARRIQEAIIPDTKYIQKFLPESFILYKPRDVVSGDFPWFLQKGDNFYIAAVDCTGHGVPGALISLIGYFLLNNIVNSSGVEEPSIILDMLDEQVTRTLKQDEPDSTTRDGMDIALCKINPKEAILEYAGAHRPLMYIANNELKEIKGDKYPIGGGQYKNRSKFKNSVIKYEKGDSFYIFSDGFPDQFGGENNRKFSPRQIRRILEAHKHKTMDEVHQAFDDAFETWKGDSKQTDDVLMIGMKF